MKETVREQQERADYFQNLNSNLIKVATERANAEKERRPRKKRSGYVHLGMEQAYYSYKDSNRRMVKLECWKIRLQSPYSVLMDYRSASGLIESDLLNTFMQLMKIDSFYDNDKLESLSVEHFHHIWSAETLIFKSSYKANALQGFWEVELWLNCPIEILPEMLPQNKKRNKKPSGNDKSAPDLDAPLIDTDVLDCI